MGYFGIIISITLLYIIGVDIFKKDNSHFNDGMSYYNERKYSAAQQLLQSEADNGNSEVYPFLGHSFLNLGENEKAIKYLKLALDDPNLKDNADLQKGTLFNLGYTYWKMGNKTEAKKYLLQASDMGSNNATKLLKEIGE